MCHWKRFNSLFCRKCRVVQCHDKSIRVTGVNGAAGGLWWQWMRYCGTVVALLFRHFETLWDTVIFTGWVTLRHCWDTTNWRHWANRWYTLRYCGSTGNGWDTTNSRSDAAEMRATAPTNTNTNTNTNTKTNGNKNTNTNENKNTSGEKDPPCSLCEPQQQKWGQRLAHCSANVWQI